MNSADQAEGLVAADAAALFGVVAERRVPDGPVELAFLDLRESAGADPAPRTLLPVGTVALAVLASRVHDWQLGIRSPYLPASLLSAPQQHAD